MLLSQRRIVLPAMLLAVVITTLVYGYHSAWSINLSRPRPPPPGPHGFGEEFKHHGEPPAEPPVGPGGPPPKEHEGSPWDVPPAPPPGSNEVGSGHSHGEAFDDVSGPFDSYLWSAEELSQMERVKTPSWTARADGHTGGLVNAKDRLRFESADLWRGKLGEPELNGNSRRLPRPHVPQRSDYPSNSAWMRQVIPGEFRHGAENIFIMLKTGAETQWKRMPAHFMTTLTRTNNFAIYSDTPGSMFGHEIINILADLPEAVQSGSEFKRYKAHMQMHDEHWNWAPHMLKAEGGWDVDKYKNIPMLADAYAKNPNCEWYVWMDDDSYVFYDNLAKWLDTMNPEEMVYTGATAGLETDRFGFMHFAHGGSVVVVSHAVAEALFGPNAANGGQKNFLDFWAAETMRYCCGDAMVGIMLRKELGVELYRHPMLEGEDRRWFGEPFQGESPSSIILTKEQLCNPIVSWHHVNMHDIELLWEYERLWNKDRFITYNDIYRDFILPYVVDRRPNWQLVGEHLKVHNDPSEKYWNEQAQEELAPSGSEDNCRITCEDNSYCTAWSYRGEPAECKLALVGITLGEAANQWNKQEGWVTGYRVDRIRSWRAQATCDPLEEVDGVWNDNEESSEGYFVHLMRDANRYTAFKQDSTILD